MANNSDIEIWKDITNYEGCYQVSNLGNVRSLDRLDNRGYKRKGKMLKKSLNSNRYYVVCLSKQGKNITNSVHTLVATTFMGNERGNGNSGLVVDHIDNDSINNRLDNLQLITQRQNASKDIKGGSSRFVGVSWHKASKKWRSEIQSIGKPIWLGNFETELAAHKVYQAALERINKGLAPK